MAIVDDLVWTISITFRDRDPNPSSLTVYYDGAESAANVQGYITGALLPAAQTLSNAVVTGYRYSFGGEETDPLLLLAPEESDIERKGVFTFDDDGRGTMTLQLPSIKNTYVVDGTQFLDPANADVAAFVNAIVSTGVLDTASARNFRGNALIARKGPIKKIHRGSKKG